MPFDLSTAKPVYGGFDITTAKPVYPEGSHPAPPSEQEFRKLMSSVEGNDPDAGNYLMRFLSGFSDMGSGLVQLGAQAAERMGFESAGQFKTDFEDFRNAFERTTEIDAPGVGGEVAEVAGKFAPAAVIPGGVAGNLAKRAATGAVSGAGIGASEFVGEGESRAANTAKGAAFGAGGPLVLSGGAKLASAGTKKVLRAGAKVEDMVKVLEDFAVSGASPTAGQATGNKFYQGVETLMSKYLGGGPINRALEKTTDSVQKTLVRMADDISPVRGAEAAGRVIQKGVAGEGGFVDRFLEKSAGLWKTVDDKIGKTQVRVGATKATLKELVSDGKAAQILNDPKIARIKTIFDDTGDTLPYTELQRLRSVIGRKLGSKELVSDMPRAELKQIYGAISRDIQEAASGQGDDVLHAFQRANNYTRSGHVRLDDFVERVTNKQDLDKVFDAVVKGGEGTGVVNAFKRSLKPDEWEAVVSNVVRRMGKANNSVQDNLGEVFSLNTFLTNWNKLGPAKKALFSGSKKLNEYSKALDSIASTASVVRQDLTQMANPSGSGQAAVNIGTGVGVAASAAVGNYPLAMSLIGAVSINNGFSRLISNPKFVKWLAVASKSAPSKFPAHISRLAIIAREGTEEDAESMEGLLSRIKTLAGKSPQNKRQSQ